jgi:putative methionine-R-sulfoxide reductase with GAF domain
MASRDEHVRTRIEELLDRSRDVLRPHLDRFIAELESGDAAEREAGLAAANTLLDGIRALDAATSLSEILDALTRSCAAHVPRVALLLREGDRLRGWAWSGFDGDARALDVPTAAAGVVGDVACSGERLAVPAMKSSSFLLQPSGESRAALAIPLRVDGVVIGVLYADNDGEAPATVPSAWPEVIETLARHAERCLEVTIARRLPELIRLGAAERARHQALRRDEEAAQRYARLLVAEIKLYHEPLVDEGRREGNLLRLLRPHIERAQQLYEERVAAAVRARTNYFEQELVRTLADGDAALLGMGHTT